MKTEADEKDELRSEYDLKSLRIRKVGPRRKAFGKPSDLKEATTESILQAIEEDTSDKSDLC